LAETIVVGGDTGEETNEGGAIGAAPIELLLALLEPLTVDNDDRNMRFSSRNALRDRL
jgi:hypothetical protein